MSRRITKKKGRRVNENEGIILWNIIHLYFTNKNNDKWGK